MDEDPDLAILGELQEHARRVYAEQSEAMASLDRKAESMVGLGTGALAGGVGIGAFMAEKVEGWGAGLVIVLAFAAAVNLVAIYHFVRSFVGSPSERIVRSATPDLDWVARKAADDAWTLIESRLAIIQGFRDAFNKNVPRMESAVQNRQRGLRFLMSAIVGYALVAYILALLVALAR